MRKELDWLAPSGEVRRFNVERGPVGLWMPPVDFASDSLLLAAGERARKVRHSGRPVAIPTFVEGTDASDCYDEIRDWMRALDTTRGAGAIRSTAPDGVTRELYECFYTGGWEGDEAPELRSSTIMRATARFRAMDPYWYDPVGIGDVFVAAEPLAFFPGPPFSFGSSAVIGDGAVVNNPGDVEAWPVWTINAPFSRVVMENVTTGKTMFVDLAMESGWLTIDTRDKTVLDDSGANQFAGVAADVNSSLWSFAPGDNEVNITATGSTAGVTQVRYVLFPRYLTP